MTVAADLRLLLVGQPTRDEPVALWHLRSSPSVAASMRRSVGVRSGDGYHSTTTCPGAVNGQNAEASHVRDSHPRMLPEPYVSRPVRRLNFDLAPLLRSELPWLDANRVRNC